jgi:hypothetical protein
MNKQQRDREMLWQQGMEAVLFLVAAALGIYGLGQGLTGLMISGQPMNLGWVAVAGIAFLVLSAQMARVHDSWPHRPAKARSTSEPQTEAKPEPASKQESR